MEKLISFPDFEATLLVKFAVRVGGDFELAIKASEAASLIAGRFRRSWIDVCAEELQQQKLLTPISSFDQRYRQDGDNETLYKLTPEGLRSAIERSEALGQDLWAEIEDLELQSGAETSAVDFVPEGPVVQIDRTAQLFLDLEREIRDTIKHAQLNNELMSEIGGQRRVKEVEAGRVLLEADSIDAGLVHRTLLPALRGLLKVVSDEILKSVIRKAIEALLLFLAMR